MGVMLQHHKVMTSFYMDLDFVTDFHKGIKPIAEANSGFSHMTQQIKA